MAAATLISFACRALQLPYATLRVPAASPCRKDARASCLYQRSGALQGVTGVPVCQLCPLYVRE